MKSHKATIEAQDQISDIVIEIKMKPQPGTPEEQKKAVKKFLALREKCYSLASNMYLSACMEEK